MYLSFLQEFTVKNIAFKCVCFEEMKNFYREKGTICREYDYFSGGNSNRLKKEKFSLINVV